MASPCKNIDTIETRPPTHPLLVMVTRTPVQAADKVLNALADIDTVAETLLALAREQDTQANDLNRLAEKLKSARMSLLDGITGRQEYE